MSKEILLQAREIRKIYKRGSEDIAAVNGISLDIEKGEFVSFIGPSGSGKTTLINILGCLDNPTSGSLAVDNKKIFESGRMLSEFELTKFRRELFGYIFQKFYLISTLTVYENVVLPFAFFKKNIEHSEIGKLLSLLGIEKRMYHLPSELSGGEMQRVAIARALVNHPKIILADEPTGNLDTKRMEEIKEILLEAVAELCKMHFNLPMIKSISNVGGK